MQINDLFGAAAAFETVRMPDGTEAAIPAEHAAVIYVNEQPAFRVVCTPQLLPQLALGRLLTEGWIASAEEVEQIAVCAEGLKINIYLNHPLTARRAAAQEVSSCCTDNVALGSPVEVTISGPHPGAPEPAGEEPDQVPVVGSVAAGAPILAQECIEDYLTFDTGGLTGEHFALRVRGESMRYAGILPGDLVVVHQQQDARSGEIVVALFEDEATVKTLRRRDGHTWLMPENPDYEPIDGDGCTILGKVVAVVRRY